MDLEELISRIESFPNDPDALYNLGRHYLKQEEYDKALEQFKRAASLKLPCAEPGEPHYSMAIVHTRLQEWEEVVLDVGRTGRTLSDNEHVFELRAAAYENLDEIGKALQDWDMVIAIAPHKLRPYKKRAELYIQLSRFGEAIADLSKVLDDSDDPSLRFRRGLCHLYSDSPELARDDIEQSLACIPYNKSCLEDRLTCTLYLAEACLLIEDWHRLAVACEQALAIDPDCAQAYAYRHDLRQALGDLEGAARDLQRLEQIDPEMFVATTTDEP